MTYSELAEACNRILDTVDKYKDQIPEDLAKTVTEQVNKLLVAAMEAIHAKWAAEAYKEGARIAHQLAEGNATD